MRDKYKKKVDSGSYS